jgi:hypothetical protein
MIDRVLKQDKATDTKVPVAGHIGRQRRPKKRTVAGFLGIIHSSDKIRKVITKLLDWCQFLSYECEKTAYQRDFQIIKQHTIMV